MIDWIVAAVSVKALLYATALAASGGVLFLALFAAQLTQPERQRIVALVRTTAVAALCLTIARIMVLSGMLGGEIESLWDWSLIRVMLEGSEGEAGLARAAGLIAIAAFTFTTSVSQALAVFGAVLIAASFALTGHTGSIGPGVLPRFLVAGHVFAVAYWIGALVPLFTLATGPDPARVGSILKRFGDVAVVVIASLIAAGGVLLWLLLGSVEATVSSPYGRLVLVKLAFVAGLLALAAFNKVRLTPGVAAGDRTAVAALRWSIMCEIALAACILTVTATFTTVVGPPELE
jgi:putative copper export protein